MYFICTQLRPTHNHEFYDTYGDGFVNCWINTNSETMALKSIKENFKINKFEIIKILESYSIKKNDVINDKKAYKHFKDALNYQEKYDYYQSPKYTILLGKYIVKKIDIQKNILLEFWIDVEFISDKFDKFAAKYWEDNELKENLEIQVKKLIDIEGFKYINSISLKPVDYVESSVKEKQYQDEAEEYGYSMVFKQLEKNENKGV
jgi:hypothetical protein